MGRVSREKELLPKVLAAVRTLAGLTQSELADRIGVHRSYISMLESGSRTTPSDAVLYRIAEVCGISYEDLCRKIDRVPNHKEAVREWIEKQDNPLRVRALRAIVQMDDDDLIAIVPVVERLAQVAS